MGRAHMEFTAERLHQTLNLPEDVRITEVGVNGDRVVLQLSSNTRWNTYKGLNENPRVTAHYLKRWVDPDDLHEERPRSWSIPMRVAKFVDFEEPT